MTRRRYELTDREWSIIAPLLPNKPRGVPRVDDAADFLNGILWRFGLARLGRKYPNDMARRRPATIASCDGRKAGVWDRLLEAVSEAYDRRHRHDRLLLCPRSPARSHGKKGDRDDGGMGRSRGGLTSKIHALVDAEGRPVTLRLTGGQVADCKEARSPARRPSARATSCSPTRATTATPSAPRRQSARPGQTSRPRQTARAPSPSPPGSIASETSWSGSSTASNTSEASPRATTRTRPTTSPPSSSSQPASGACRNESTA